MTTEIKNGLILYIQIQNRFYAKYIYAHTFYYIISSVNNVLNMVEVSHQNLFFNSLHAFVSTASLYWFYIHTCHYNNLLTQTDVSQRINNVTRVFFLFSCFHFNKILYQNNCFNIIFKIFFYYFNNTIYQRITLRWNRIA